MASPSRSQELLIKLLNEQQDRQRQGLPPLTQTQLNEVANVNGYRDFDQFSRSVSYLATGQAETKAEGDIADKMREWFGGLTFELADDLEGILRVVALGEDRPLSDIMEQIQMERQNYQTTNPNEAAALQVSGGLTTPVSPGMGAAKVAPALAKGLGNATAGLVMGGKAGQIAQKVASTVPARGAVMGATDAAAYSAFSGNDAGQVGTDALTGAAIGAPLAKLGDVVGEYGGKAYQFGKEQLGRLLNTQTGGSGGGGRIFNTFPELRDAPPDRRTALEEIRNLNELGNMPTSQYRDELAQLQGAGKADSATFLDVANRVGGSDNPIYGAADAIMYDPYVTGLFKKTVAPRQEKNAVLNAIRNDFSQTAGPTMTQREVINRAREAQAASKPYYQNADPQVVFETDKIRNYLTDDTVQRAYQDYRPKYIRAQKAEGVIDPQPLPAEPTTPMEIRTLDAVQKAVRRKQGLDRGNPLATEDAYDMDNLRTIQRMALDDAGKQVPDYQKARQIYAEGQGIDEYRSGMKAINTSKTPDDILDEFAKLQPGIKQDAFRSGLVNAVIGKFSRNKAEMPNLAQEFRNNELMEKLSVVFPSEEALNAFLNRSRMEDDLAIAARAGSGSQTQPRQQRREDMSDRRARISDLNPMKIVDRVLDNVDEQVQRQRDQVKFRNMGDILFDQGPQNINRNLDQLNALQRMIDEQERLRRYGQGAGSRSGILGVDPDTRESFISLLF